MPKPSPLSCTSWVEVGLRRLRLAPALRGDPSWYHCIWWWWFFGVAVLKLFRKNDSPFSVFSVLWCLAMGFQASPATCIEWDGIGDGWTIGVFFFSPISCKLLRLNVSGPFKSGLGTSFVIFSEKNRKVIFFKKFYVSQTSLFWRKFLLAFRKFLKDYYFFSWLILIPLKDSKIHPSEESKNIANFPIKNVASFFFRNNMAMKNIIFGNISKITQFFILIVYTLEEHCRNFAEYSKVKKSEYFPIKISDFFFFEIKKKLFLLFSWNFLDILWYLF